MFRRDAQVVGGSIAFWLNVSSSGSSYIGSWFNNRWGSQPLVSLFGQFFRFSATLNCFDGFLGASFSSGLAFFRVAAVSLSTAATWPCTSTGRPRSTDYRGRQGCCGPWFLPDAESHRPQGWGTEPEEFDSVFRADIDLFHLHAVMVSSYANMFGRSRLPVKSDKQQCVFKDSSRVSI